MMKRYIETKDHNVYCIDNLDVGFSTFITKDGKCISADDILRIYDEPEFWYCINCFVEDGGYEPLLIGHNAKKVFDTEEEAKNFALSHPDIVGTDYQISKTYDKVYHWS